MDQKGRGISFVAHAETGDSVVEYRDTVLAMVHVWTIRALTNESIDYKPKGANDDENAWIHC